MKQFSKLLIGMTLYLFVSCGQEQMKLPEKVTANFEVFINKEKFLQDNKIFYPGIADLKLKPILTEKINLSAIDFKKLSETNTATDKDFQDAIKNGLDRFKGIYLDTEDRERVCQYYEELMDLVGLESSGGHLNNFMYGVLL